jgi:hypothetical protein
LGPPVNLFEGLPRKWLDPNGEIDQRRPDPYGCLAILTISSCVDSLWWAFFVCH